MYRVVLTMSAPTEEREKEFAEELEAAVFEYWDEHGRSVGLLSRIEKVPEQHSGK